MQKPCRGDVHFIPKGKIGFIAHTLNQFQANGWTRYPTPDLAQRASWYVEVPAVKEEVLQLAYLIPHSTPVLVLSEPLLLSSSVNGDPHFYYHILWGEIECWVRTHYLINPYHTDK